MTTFTDEECAAGTTYVVSAVDLYYMKESAFSDSVVLAKGVCGQAGQIYLPLILNSYP